MPQAGPLRATDGGAEHDIEINAGMPDMKIELGFRDTTLPIEVPEKNLQAVLQPSAIRSQA